MMNGCGKFDDALLDLVFGELDDNEADALRTHAAGCSACAAAVEAMSSTRRLSAQIIHPSVPSGLDNVILSEARTVAARSSRPDEAAAHHRPGIDRPSRPGFLESLRMWLLHPAFAGAAVIALVIVITVFINDKTRESAAPPASVESVIAERSVQVYEPSPAPIAQAPKGSVQPITQNLNNEGEGGDKAKADTSLPVQPIVERQPQFATGDEAVKAVATEAASPKTKMLESSSKGYGRGRVGSVKEEAETGGGSGFMPSAPTEMKHNSAEKSRRASSAPTKPSYSPKFDDVTAPGGPEPSFAPPPPEKKAASKNETSADLADEAPAEAAPMQPSYEDEKAPMKEKTGNSADIFDEGMDAYNRGDCNTAVLDLSIVASSPSLYPGKAPSALHYIARCEKRTGKCAKAVGSYDRLLTHYPSYVGRPDALYEAAACYKRLGRTDKARELLNSLRSIHGFESRAEEALRQL
jgi:TolA-binding protein